jgi:hypothetical protein
MSGDLNAVVTSLVRQVNALTAGGGGGGEVHIAIGAPVSFTSGQVIPEGLYFANPDYPQIYSGGMSFIVSNGTNTAGNVLSNLRKITFSVG